ncbi:hypothetical protein JCM10207_005881 [Rhodosporidiobolus poonsookiae]
MHLIRPSWVVHIDDSRPQKPAQTLYSLDIHPDGSRLATGGIDSIIRVWSTVPILDEKAEKDDKCPKLLSTLAAHTGSVMAVRWNNAGSHLASGADDRVVMIWAHDGSGGGKVWGSETTNVENWKAARRLVGHNSDVAGVDWSPDDAYLASVGLDNTVLIWSGSTFECIARLDGHTGFVKGVVFDPAGQFLATQSDDNSLKIWTTKDWRLHAQVGECFEEAPKAQFMKPAWSPDGAYLVAPNAMNGPVFCAAVVDRQTWKSPNSLIGHPDIVQAAAYNPLLFLRDAAAPPGLTNSCSLLALCAQGTVSLWFTDLSQPFVVLQDVVDREVLDMRWSKDGKQLWISSSDGHVAVLVFSYSEYAPLAPPDTQSTLFATQYGVAPRAKLAISRPLSAASSIGALGAGGATGTLSAPNTLVARKGPNAKRPRVVQPVIVGQPQPQLQPQIQAMQQQAQFAPAQPSPLQNAMQIPVQAQVAGGGVGANPFASAPTFNAQPLSLTGAGAPFASTSAAVPQQQQQVFAAPFGAPVPPAVNDLTPSAKKRKTSAAAGAGVDAPAAGGWPYPYPPPPHFPPAPAHGHGYPYPHAPGYPHPHPYAPYPPPEAMAMPGYAGAPRVSEAAWRLQGHTLGAEKGKGKGKGKDKTGEEEVALLERDVERELVPSYLPADREPTFRVSHGPAAQGRDRLEKALAVPAVMSVGRVRLEDVEGGDVFEWRNFAEGERKGTAELTVVNERKDKSLWVDYLPRYVVRAAGSEQLTAVSLEDGGLVAWSPTGRRLMPTLVLDAPCAFLEAEGSFLLAITALGTLSVYHLSPSIPRPRGLFPPQSLAPLLASCATRAHPHPQITTSALLPSGVPLVALSTGATFSYDADLCAWTRLCETWWAASSEAWDGRRGRGRVDDKAAAGRGVVRKVEGAVNEVVVNRLANGEDGDEDGETTEEEDDEEESGEKDKQPEKEKETRDEAAKEQSDKADVEMNGVDGAAATEASSSGAKPASAPADAPSSSTVSTPQPRPRISTRPPKRAVPSGAPSSPTASNSDFRTAATLAHLETRLHAAVALDSPAEYRAFLQAYAKKLAEEGLRSKAEELVRELLGPVYHKPGVKDEDVWSPTILGLQKRDLLRDPVLRELARSRTTQALASEYQDTLKKVTAPW